MNEIHQLIGSLLIGFIFYFWFFFLAPKMIPRKEEPFSEDLKDFIDDIEHHTQGKCKVNEVI